MNHQPHEPRDAASLGQLPLSDPGQPLGNSGEATPRCCSLGKLTRGVSLRSVAMAGMLATTLAALATAGYFAGVASSLKKNPADSIAFPTAIDATAAATSEKYSIATGMVSEEGEGFFVLDHNSGLLQCTVFYPRMGKFLGNFTANAGDLVGAGGKGGSYIMVTGQSDMTRGGRGAQIAPTLVYVLNTASGNYAAFAVPFDRQAAVTGRPQQAPMIPMGTGTASVVPTR